MLIGEGPKEPFLKLILKLINIYTDTKTRNKLLIMMSIQTKFTTIAMESGLKYVSAVLINDQYKTIYRKSGSTQKKLIKELKLTNYIGIWRRHKDHTKVGSIATKILDHFKSQVHDLYLEINELETPKEGDNKDNHIELLRLISLLPDVKQEPIANPVEPIATPRPTITLEGLPPIIELEETEMFKDVNDQPFHIEVRGERTKDGILFKAKDIARFADNARLIETMTDDRNHYQEGTDYVILKKTSNDLVGLLEDLENLQRRQSPHPNSSENSKPLVTVWNSLEDLSKNKTKINRDLVYLTTAGLIRVASVSRNANANLVKLFDWLCNLFYVHKFGSHDERSELAQDLLKTILNDKLSGLYCISLGTFNELYDTMNICKETYPPETYSKHNIYKFGLSKDISTRLTQHQNKSTGYGRWSDKVSLKWMILLSDSQLSEAEGLLSEKFKSKGLSFNYVDVDGISRNELIAVGPKDDNKVKTIYKQTLSYFPSKENDLCKLMAEMQTNHELSLLKMEQHYTKQLNDVKMEATIAKHETDIAKKDIEILMLKLTIATKN